MSTTTQELTQQVRQAGQWVAPLQTEMARVVVGGGRDGCRGRRWFEQPT